MTTTTYGATTKLTSRADGRIVVEILAPEQIEADIACPDWRVGDEGVLVECERVMQPTGTVGVALIDAPDGAPGNMDPHVRRMHGWRGTTNDVARHAHGWRRVESIAPRKRGYGWRIILGRDLCPDDA